MTGASLECPREDVTTFVEWEDNPIMIFADAISMLLVENDLLSFTFLAGLY